MRLFVAIPVPENIRAPLLSISSGIRGARWVRPEGMHITLFFAGEVDRAQANDLDAELESVHMLPFELECRSLGYFERGQRILCNRDLHGRNLCHHQAHADIEHAECCLYLITATR